jgi:hypothetical protein
VLGSNRQAKLGRVHPGHRLFQSPIRLRVKTEGADLASLELGEDALVVAAPLGGEQGSVPVRRVIVSAGDSPAVYVGDGVKFPETQIDAQQHVPRVLVG